MAFDPDEGWDLHPSIAHPTARNLLREEFFWDSGDDNSPFGNDTGADTLHLYREWRGTHAQDPASQFTDALFDKWDVSDSDWVLPDGPELRLALESAHYSILTWDDAAIAVAFGQLVLEGRVEASALRRALLAINRQATQTVVTFRGWVDPLERRERLEAMREALIQASSAAV